MKTYLYSPHNEQPNKENLRLWVKSLRETEEPQIQGHLGKEEGGRCCLGVACDVAVANNVIPAPVVRNKGILHYGTREDWLELPAEVANWLGISKNPRIGTGLTATVANDDLGWTFGQIATLLEEKYELNED